MERRLAFLADSSASVSADLTIKSRPHSAALAPHGGRDDTCRKTRACYNREG